MVSVNRLSTILDGAGRPFEVAEPDPAERKNGHGHPEARAKSTLLHVGGTYAGGLMGSRAPAAYRARDPFSNNPWVLAAALRTALSTSPAEYRVYRETEAELRVRAKRAQAAGFVDRPRAGRDRRAVQRWIQRSVWARAMRSKAIEPALSHPLMDLLLHPNPYQRGNELMLLTVLWLSVRGEATWVLTDEEGEPSGLETPERIWPVPPDCLTPLHESPQGGEITGWELRRPRWMKGYRGGLALRLDVGDVVQFKLPNPADPSRGFSPLTASASSIELDLLMRTSLRNLIENGSMPANILLHPEEMEEDERNVVREEFTKLGREKRTAILSGGLKLASVAFSPQQMGFIEQPRTAKDEVLAPMGTPESVLGRSEFTNYATALANDYSFWDKNVYPLLKLIETALDATLFAPETDRTFGMFDLTQVEALRAGLADKALIAERLSASTLHMPPEVSLELCGLDGVPDYPGKDVAFGSIGLTPIPFLLEEPEAPPAPPVEPPADPAEDGGDGEDGADGGGQEGVDDDQAVTPEDSAAAARRRAPSVRTTRARKARNGRRNREFIEMQSGVEAKYRAGYRSWISEERRLVLAAFDSIDGRARALAAGAHRKQNVDLQVVLPVGPESAKRLAGKTRKLQVESLLQVFEFTIGEIGVPTFSIDDSAFVEYFRTHEGHFTGEASSAIRRNLARTLEEGLREGESLSELRSRIGQVFDVSASSPRTLQTARTTTSSFMSGVRDRMFHLQGIEAGEWSTSGDEHVRQAHVLFGEAGPRALGFNFLELNEEPGRLEHPGDTRAPFGQIVNCRCIWIPTA